jgi:type II secretory pathway pseudopilin PulG
MRRLRRLLRNETGYSLVELVTVMVVLVTILTALTTVFIQGSKAELDTNRRSQAQIQAVGAFDQLRRDVHAGSSACVSGTTLTIYNVSGGCGTSSGNATYSWCPVASGSQYKLYRKSGSTCDATGKLYAESLTSSAVFAYTSSVASTSLAKVHVDVRVNVNPAKALDSFELTDDIVLRNSTRS